MTSFDLKLADDHFTLLHLPRAQRLDGAQLDAHFRELQGRVHPDKHAHATPADQRLAMQWATRINEAYQTLKSPLARARYLLGLLGYDVAIESNTAMPAEFLIEQMELREAVEEAKLGADETALEGLAARLRGEMRAETERLARLIDDERDFAAAGGLVRQLMFHEKLLAEVDAALDAVTC